MEGVDVVDKRLTIKDSVILTARTLDANWAFAGWESQWGSDAVRYVTASRRVGEKNGRPGYEG
ncbi:unnamed protein product [Acanthoscelides obtectus]|uniref:Uncharacterized protein n=1 Tax=Acanthoscelides obtectus TaxID=200917 RepID=A0A9P0M2C9_ACAOB|nr:unnamed protein product [Acanthoscelides obtectus]CAK1656606.1 hypothetical protein AOBTE_LOCUS19824 [Acanthoscelides obtectus]